MKIKKFIIVFLISIFTFGKIPKAVPVPLLNTHKQGIYDITQFCGYTAYAKLITPDRVTIFIIIDSKGNQKFYRKFYVANEVVNVGLIEKGDIGILVGGGEIAFFNYK